MEFDLNKRHCFWFNELAKIPHGSTNEKRSSDFIAKIARDKGLNYVQDELHNIIVYMPGSKGYEASAPLMIQAHIDMVCEKNKDVDHDFLKDPLDLYVEDGYLKAKGTTLGADDGMGVAYMLAIMEDASLIHPPLELVFTTQEEVGLIGSLALKKEYFKSKRVISLDGGGEVVTSVSSAGGCVFIATKKFQKKRSDDQIYILSIRGLSGGHSGGEIDKEKGNANVIAARMLEELDQDVCLAKISGGLKDNAIPRECDISFSCSLAYDALKVKLDKSARAIAEELADSDSGYYYELSKDEDREVMSSDDSKDILDFIYLMPNGFMHRSMSIEGLTITSLNLGVITTTDDKVILDISIRSAIDSAIDDLISRLAKLAYRLSFTYSTSARYPGWNYKKDSKMRLLFEEALRYTTGQDLKEVASHGGCECGVFNSLLDGADIITLGAKTYDIHTPDERLDIASFDRSYMVLKNIIERSVHDE